MANFCGKCGSPIDAATGFCPNCDKEKFSGAGCVAVVEETPVVETAKEQPQAVEVKMPKKRKPKAVTTIFTVLLSVLLFVAMVLSVLLVNVRRIATEENIEKVIDKMQYNDFINMIQNENDDQTMRDVELFYSRLSSNYDVEVSHRKVNRFINKSSFKDFIAEKISDGAEDFMEGDAVIAVTKAEVRELLYENREEVRDIFGINMDYDDMNEIADWIVQERVTFLDTDKLMDETPAVYKTISMCISWITLAVILLIALLIILLMLKNSWSQALCGIGIVFVIWGAIGSIAALIAAWVQPVWEMIIVNGIIRSVVGELVIFNGIICVILLSIGILALVARKLIHKFFVK